MGAGYLVLYLGIFLSVQTFMYLFLCLYCEKGRAFEIRELRSHWPSRERQLHSYMGRNRLTQPNLVVRGVSLRSPTGSDLWKWAGLITNALLLLQ